MKAYEVHLATRRCALSSSERAVLREIAMYSTGDEGVCSASQETLALDTDLGLRTVERCVARLRQLGVLVKVRRGYYRVVVAAIPPATVAGSAPTQPAITAGTKDEPATVAGTQPAITAGSDTEPATVAERTRHHGGGSVADPYSAAGGCGGEERGLREEGTELNYTLPQKPVGRRRISQGRAERQAQGAPPAPPPAAAVAVEVHNPGSRGSTEGSAELEQLVAQCRAAQERCGVAWRQSDDAAVRRALGEGIPVETLLRWWSYSAGWNMNSRTLAVVLHPGWRGRCEREDKAGRVADKARALVTPAGENPAVAAVRAAALREMLEAEKKAAK